MSLVACADAPEATVADTSAKPTNTAEESVEQAPTELTDENSSPYELVPLEYPWPDEISRAELIGAALYETFEYLDSTQASECDIGYSVYMEDYFHPTHVGLVDQLTADSVALFCQEMTQDIVVVGGTHDFVLESVATHDLPSDQHGGVCGVPVGEAFSNDWMVACAWDGEIVWIGDTLGNVRFGELTTDNWRVSVAFHEIMHLVQDQQFSGGSQGMPPRPDPRFRPVWLIEGGADFLADAVGQYLEVQEYSWTTPTDRNGARITLEQSSYLEQHEDRSSPFLGPIDYYAGQVASEYLVASVGFDRYMQILNTMETNSGDFDRSFEQAIGISLEEFYDKFEVMHKNLYDKNVIINE